VSIVFAFVSLLPAIGIAGDGPLEPVDPSRADEHALWLGHRMLAIAAVIRIPHAPDAIEAVPELGLNSRYYIMVRGLLVIQLRGDMNISQAPNIATMRILAANSCRRVRRQFAFSRL
jgi:hypothetical protein